MTAPAAMTIYHVNTNNGRFAANGSPFQTNVRQIFVFPADVAARVYNVRQHQVEGTAEDVILSELDTLCKPRHCSGF